MTELNSTVHGVANSWTGMNDFHFILELFGQLSVLLYFSLFNVYLVLYDFSEIS